jgi:MFS family permease
MTLKSESSATNDKLKPAILSLSLLTVMAGAAVSPALGGISAFYREVDPLLIKMILTLPAIFIILTSLFFTWVENLLETKNIALLGISLYLVGGCCGGVASNIWLLLFFRALLGVSVGLLMPLSTGLISYYFAPQERSKLMGYSAAMNNLGGIIAMSLSGYLVTISWRASFLVYLIGLAAMVLIAVTLPNTKIKRKSSRISKKQLTGSSFHLIAMFLTFIIFYVLVTNFAIIATIEQRIPLSLIGIIMSIQTVAGCFIGFIFGRVEARLGSKIRVYAPVCFMVGYLCLALLSHIVFVALGVFFIGLGLGLMVPHLNSSLLKMTNKDDATSIMALMSAALYGGQFVSPIIIQVAGNFIAPSFIRYPYFLAVLLSVILIGFLQLNNRMFKQKHPENG